MPACLPLSRARPWRARSPAARAGSVCSESCLTSSDAEAVAGPRGREPGHLDLPYVGHVVGRLVLAPRRRAPSSRVRAPALVATNVAGAEAGEREDARPRRLRRRCFAGPCWMATPAATAACAPSSSRWRSVGSLSAFFLDLALPARDRAPRRSARRAREVLLDVGVVEHCSTYGRIDLECRHQAASLVAMGIRRIPSTFVPDPKRQCRLTKAMGRQNGTEPDRLSDWYDDPSV